MRRDAGLSVSILVEPFRVVEQDADLARLHLVEGKLVLILLVVEIDLAVERHGIARIGREKRIRTLNCRKVVVHIAHAPSCHPAAGGRLRRRRPVAPAERCGNVGCADHCRSRGVSQPARRPSAPATAPPS
jgi:hypothetical protein